MVILPVKLLRDFFSLTQDYSTTGGGRTVSLVTEKKNEKRAIYSSLLRGKELILWGVWISSAD
jgi:hypothetical protein